jgi:mannose-6-phosphate isomerase-like protein (cupin superfamily)
MKIRRVVTGHTREGKSTIASDELVDPQIVCLLPEAEIHSLWGADTPCTFPDEGSAHSFAAYFPPVGGFRFCMTTILPGSVKPAEGLDMKAALEEVDQKLPGLFAYMDPNNPGMHTSDTIDFEYIISGEVFLELDDGVQVRLRAGDTVVQNGTRHAWRNKGSKPCRMVVCLIGAHRKQ